MLNFASQVLDFEVIIFEPIITRRVWRELGICVPAD